jgi:hypothetical protein
MLCWDAAGKALWLNTTSNERVPYVKGGPHPPQAEQKGPGEDFMPKRIHVCTESYPVADFIPSQVFDGSKSGYSFKMGASGMGYYKDPLAKPATVSLLTSRRPYGV